MMKALFILISLSIFVGCQKEEIKQCYELNKISIDGTQWKHLTNGGYKSVIIFVDECIVMDSIMFPDYKEKSDYYFNGNYVYIKVNGEYKCSIYMKLENDCELNVSSVSGYGETPAAAYKYIE